MPTPPRIPLTGRLTPAQVAEHNAFIDRMRQEEAADDRQAWVSQPSQFVGITRGLPDHTTA